MTLGKCPSDQQLQDVEDLMTNPPRHGTLGYRHCQAKINRFSRSTEAVPIADMEAATVVSALLSTWIFRFDVPLRIRTD